MQTKRIKLIGYGAYPNYKIISIIMMNGNFIIKHELKIELNYLKS